MITGFLLFMGCKPTVRNYIPGTYITSWATEFSEARDTIQITSLPKAGSDTYQVIRRTYFTSQGKPNYKMAHWIGIFNSGNKTVIINKNGRLLSFDPDNNEMKMGSTTYKKL